MGNTEDKSGRSPSQDGFSRVAEFYELLSDGEKRLQREAPLLAEWFDRAPGGRVADLACGTGLHAAFMAERGATVTAFDLSEDMLAYARARRPHAHVDYLQADMRNVHGGPWDLIICLGNSLSLLGSLSDVEAVMRAVNGALAPGGLFGVQVINYASPGARQARHRVEERRTGDTELVAVKSLISHGDHTLLSIVFHVLEGGCHRTVSETAMLVNLSADDLRGAAERAGLATESVLGGFDRKPFDPEQSTDLIGLFRKPA